MANQFVRMMKALRAYVHDIDGLDEGDSLEAANLERVLRLPFAADAAASDTWTRYIMLAEYDVTITEVNIIPDAALTANDTNYATLSFATGAVGSLSSKDSFTTKITGGSGDWVAATREAFTVVSSTDSLAQGEALSVVKAVAAAGVVIPAHVIEIKYKLANEA